MAIISGLVYTDGLGVLSLQMTLFLSSIFVDPGAERVMQLLVAGGPFALLILMRMVLGRSKELMLAVWLSVGWFAIRASVNPQLEGIVRPIERLLQG